MLHCHSLKEFEKLLHAQIQGVSLVGQLHLTEEDGVKLGCLIREKVGKNIEDGTWELEKLFPTCLACFLVLKGHARGVLRRTAAPSGLPSVYYDAHQNNRLAPSRQSYDDRPPAPENLFRSRESTVTESLPLKSKTL